MVGKRAWHRAVQRPRQGRRIVEPNKGSNGNDAATAKTRQTQQLQGNQDTGCMMGPCPSTGRKGLDSLSCARPGVHVPAVCAGQRNQPRCAEGTRKGGQHTTNHGRVSLSIHTLVYAFGCQHHDCMQRWCAASAHTQGRARCTDACITLQEHHQQHKGLSAWHYMPTHTTFSVPGLARSEGVGN